MSIEVTAAGELLRKIAKLGLSSSFEKTSLLFGKTEKTQKQKLVQISDWYRSESLVMVLGAGASAAYGLPDWNTLLQKLLLITIKSEDDELANENGSADEKAGVLARTFSGIFEPNSLITARYLHNYFRKKNK